MPDFNKIKNLKVNQYKAYDLCNYPKLKPSAGQFS